MLMDNTLELLGITDSNIKVTRFSAESVNGEKRNVIEARLTYNVNRCPYCKSEKVVRNGSKICTCALRSFTRNALKCCTSSAISAKEELLLDTFWQVNKRLSLCGVVQSEKT